MLNQPFGSAWLLNAVPVAANIAELRDCRAWFVGAMGAVWWMLLAQLPVVLSTQSVAAHSAAAALAALQDVQRIEQRILDDEGRRISSGDVGPLEAYSFVHQSLGLLFDTALAAIRHAVAASPQKDLMVEAASLERQLRELLIAHFKEPLFFWHGPKWLIKSKLLRLLGSGPWHEKLKELSEVPVVATDLLGDKAASKEAARPLLQESKVPAIGLAVDDTFCTPGTNARMLRSATIFQALFDRTLLVLLETCCTLPPMATDATDPAHAAHAEHAEHFSPWLSLAAPHLCPEDPNATSKVAPYAVLHLFVDRAHGLPAADLNGLSDPYVTAQINDMDAGFADAMVFG
eukprot:s58_g2.t1